MINIEVKVEARMVVSPRQWDSVGGLTAATKQAVERALEDLGEDITVIATAEAM